MMEAAPIAQPRGQRRQVLGYLLSYLVVLAAWQLMSLRLGPTVMPSPLETARAALTILSTPVLAQHVPITIFRTVAGVVVSAALAVLLVLGARYLAPFRVFFLNAFYPGLRAVPPVSIALLAIVWFSLGTKAVVFVIVVTVLPIYLIALWEGLKVLDEGLLEMGYAVARNRFAVFRKLAAPMLVPTMFSATKLGFSVSFKLALVGELLAATEGIGYVMHAAQQEYKTHLVIAWTVIMLAVVVLVEYYVFNLVERKYLYRWETTKE